MSTGFQDSSNFLVGGRYRNRTGRYEVLEINGNRLRVAYDNGDEALLNAEMQSRIIRNMEQETATFEAYSGPDALARNRQYFRTIGFLAFRDNHDGGHRSAQGRSRDSSNRIDASRVVDQRIVPTATMFMVLTSTNGETNCA